MKAQIFLKNEEASLMSWITVSDKWDTQKIINYVQKEIASTVEMNIMWIKINGKKVINNQPKELKKESEVGE